MFGLSYFLQFLTFALVFFLGAVYITNLNLNIDGALSSIFCVIFAAIAAGNKTTTMQDLSTTRQGVDNIMAFLDLEDEH